MLGHIAGAVVALTAGWLIYHLVLEPQDPVWTNLDEPRALEATLEVGAQSLPVFWRGYNRRECARVTWRRELRREGSSVPLWEDSTSRTGVEPTDPESRGRVFYAPLPVLTAGCYELEFVEKADCNPVLSWEHTQAVIPFCIEAPDEGAYAVP